MEERLDYIRQFATGFKMPDFSKIWTTADDEADAGRQHTPLVMKLEYYLVRCQELALWTDPKSSVLALVAVHLAFGYLATTSNTVINLTLWAIISGFVYTTWTQRIWPEIRVEEPKPADDWTPVHPDVYSAPELMELFDALSLRAQNLYTKAVVLRRTNHGKFCVYTSFLCIILAYIGAFVSTLALLYYMAVASLVLPALVRILVKYPNVQVFINHLTPTKNTDGVDTSKKTPEDETEAKAEAKVEVSAKISDTVTDMMQSMCSTLQTGMATISSNLPDISQLEQRHKNLIQQTEAERLAAQELEEESMMPYLPVVDEANNQILETCTDPGEKDPTQVDSFQCGIEETSLIEGIDQSAMPDYDEVDQSLNPTLAVWHESSIQRQDDIASSSLDDDDENQEFLPSIGGALLLSETLDEEEGVIACQSATEDAQLSNSGSLLLDDDYDIDDFEVISASEFNQVKL